MKISIPRPNGLPLTLKMLQSEFKVVQKFDKTADIFIYYKRITPDKPPIKKTIMLQGEPPLTAGRRSNYKQFPHFHTVLAFNPTGPNVFKFGRDASIYPYAPGLNFDTCRKDLTLKNRKVYFAGRKAGYETVPDCFGSINLCRTRPYVCRQLIKQYPGTHIFGKGWPKKTKAPERKLGWRPQKQLDIKKLDVDFVLCMENSMLKNYITEKIHDGFSSDRVTLYLGAPNIEQFVPPEAFVNLNPLLNKKTKKFDIAQLIHIMKTMGQKEAEEKIKAARTWRQTLKDKRQLEMDRTTRFIIKRIKERKGA